MEEFLVQPMAALQAVAFQAVGAASNFHTISSSKPTSRRQGAAYAVVCTPRCNGVSSSRVQVTSRVSGSGRQACSGAVRAHTEESQPEAVDVVPEVSAGSRPRETRLLSVAAGLLPALLLAFVEAELPREIPMETIFHDFSLPESALKTFYMVFICVFSWGAVLFASMNDPYYESDEYRNAGGNGTQHWIYTRAEEEEVEAREELWREELRREIEDKMGDIKELEAPEEEKEKQLV